MPHPSLLRVGFLFLNLRQIDLEVPKHKFKIPTLETEGWGTQRSDFSTRCAFKTQRRGLLRGVGYEEVGYRVIVRICVGFGVGRDSDGVNGGDPVRITRPERGHELPASRRDFDAIQRPASMLVLVNVNG